MRSPCHLAPFVERCATATEPLVLSAPEAQAFGVSLGQLLEVHAALFAEVWDWHQRYYSLLAALGQPSAHDPI